MSDERENVECSTPDCCPESKRRDFLKLSALSALGAAAACAWRPVMAGPFEDHVALIPLDKKLDPKWVASLTARGEPEVYKGAELKFIGMPIGGLYAGAMYIGGDGKLWLWDIFNAVTNGVLPRKVDCEGKKVDPQNGANYAVPLEQNAPLDQGFALRINGKTHTLDKRGFKDITFRGEYPVATVTYKDSSIPVSATLTSFSPFCPLNAADSSLPAIVFRFVIKNESAEHVDASVLGWFENAVCLANRNFPNAERRNSIVGHALATSLNCSARAVVQHEGAVRSDIVFEDFEKETYDGWTVEGTAFGKGPIKKSEMPAYQGDVGARGERLVNSHNVRKGESVAGGDGHVGTLTSREFVVERNYINFLIGGGKHPGTTCVNVLIDGKIVRTATGHDNNKMRVESIDVREFQGKKARFQIVDQVAGAWGNIGVDDIVFSDKAGKTVRLDELPDFGSMTLALLNPNPSDSGTAEHPSEKPVTVALKPIAEKLTGALERSVSLAPGQEASVDFVLTWHFPNLSIRGMSGRHYASRFDSANAVAMAVAEQFEILTSLTMSWRETWNDSTLPHWFLNRTFANTSILATNTCHRFADGRFWAWEGVGCCEGTCTHVWHYAQAVARLFPELELDLRQRTDFEIAFNAANGMIGYRGNVGNGDAADGQAGTILRAYREHQMSADASFLKLNWPKIKKALQYLIALDAKEAADGKADGMIVAAQHNTLDAAWFGKIPVIASLYLAALRAGEMMARELKDVEFEKRCAELQALGRPQLEALFNGEFFIQEEDAKHVNDIGIGKGCYIDQVFGQSWANQLALGRLYDEKKIKTALASLWKYNFAPDVGPLRKSLKPGVRGRPYALAGDAGLVMCTWPLGGKRNDWEKHWQFMYFSECMTGFEWQVSGHMLAEGMITEGMAIARAIHDRYHPRLRNPYNEIECSDHYARAMASYGAFIAACGFEYHGPRGHLGFDPKINPTEFKAAFTAAEGWGSIGQRFDAAAQTQVQTVVVKYGKLKVRSLAFVYQGKAVPTRATVQVAGRDVVGAVTIEGQRVMISFRETHVIQSGHMVRVAMA
ncbi:MAG: GH116 family glycosyl-hydrolase [Planctomycetota bacterium]